MMMVAIYGSLYRMQKKYLTPTAEKPAPLPIYVDKIHIKDHTDTWCLENCDARNVEELKDVSCSH